MSALPLDGPEDASRRQFLRVGLMGALALSAVSTVAVLTGCSTPPAAKSFRFLRDNDLKVLRALIPVVLGNVLPAGAAADQAMEETLHSLDNLIFGTSRAGHKQISQLFDLLAMPATRYTVVGLSDDWDKASATDINNFLVSWSHSRVQMLRAGYLGLSQLITMSWYLQPRSWAAIGYVPPRVVA
ncbi:MAG TPA: hypothetical protein VF050_07575 [Moraxellaceae bacterium]